MKPELDMSFYLAQCNPAIIARILEQQEPKFASRYLCLLPNNLLNVVSSKITPLFFLEIMQHCNQQEYIYILSNIDTTSASYILNHTKNIDHNKLLEKLPIKHQLKYRYKNYFNYEQIGSWINPDPFVIPLDLTVKETINLIRKKDIKNIQNTIFVVDRDHLLKGYINILALLKTKGNITISSLINTNINPISPNQNIHHVLSATNWSKQTVIPVISSNNKLLGIVELSYLFHENNSFKVHNEQYKKKDLDTVTVMMNTYSEIINLLIKNF